MSLYLLYQKRGSNWDTYCLRHGTVSLSKQVLMLQRHCWNTGNYSLRSTASHLRRLVRLQQHCCKNFRSHTAVFCTLLCLAQAHTVLNSYPYLKVILFTHSPMLEHYVVKRRLQTSFCLAACLPRILAAFLPLDPLFLLLHLVCITLTCCQCLHCITLVYFIAFSLLCQFQHL